MKSWKLWGAFIICILLAAAGVFAAYRWWLAEPAPAPTEGRLVTITRDRLVTTIPAAGCVASVVEHTLSCGIAGQVREVRVSEGDRVQAGDALLTLDDGDLALAVERAQAILDQSRAQLAQVQAGPSQAELQAAQAALQAAQAARRQVEKRSLVADLAAAQAAVSSAQARLRTLREGPTEGEVAMARLALDQARNSLYGAQASRDAVVGSASASGAQKEQAEAQVLNAEVAVRMAELALQQLVEPTDPADIAAAEAQLADAQAALAQLQAQDPEGEAAQVAAQLASAQATLERLQDTPTKEAVAMAEAQVRQAQTALEQARRQQARATLTAPRAGTILSIQAHAGQWVGATTPAIVLAEDAPARIEALVHQEHIAQIQIGQAATVRLEALPDDILEGTVTTVEPQATLLNGVVGYGVTIDVGAIEPPIRPGMVAEVAITTEQADDAILAPRGALRFRDGQWRVHTRQGRRLVEVPVTVGRAAGRYMEIVSGLDEGQEVLIHTVPLAAAQMGGAQ